MGMLNVEGNRLLVTGCQQDIPFHPFQVMRAFFADSQKITAAIFINPLGWYQGLQFQLSAVAHADPTAGLFNDTKIVVVGIQQV